MLKTLSNALLDFIFPPHCHICRSFIPEAGRLHICHSCRDLIQRTSPPYCSVCGIPFHGAGTNHPCGHCLNNTPGFDAARAAAVYEGPVRELIHKFKYDYKIHLRRPLALLMVETLTDYVSSRHLDMIIPVPLHVKRLRTRGFNQAVLLGEVLVREWRIPMARSAMLRVRWTEPQINLAASQRKENVKGAFALSDPGLVSGKRILLLDDVYTTGSTVEECSRVLKKCGASEVTVITAARAAI